MTFLKAPSLTLGIEEEYQIIDPDTRELRSYITEILKGDSLILEEVKPELHQSMVEIGTKVCRNPAEVRAELIRLRGTVMMLAARGRAMEAAPRRVDNRVVSAPAGAEKCRVGSIDHLERRPAVDRDARHSAIGRQEADRAPVGQRLGIHYFGDTAHRAARKIDFRETLAEPSDAESPVALETIDEELPIPRLEDVQRLRRSGKEDERQRKERKILEGHPTNLRHHPRSR